MPTRDGLQLQMNFGSGVNRLRGFLESGDFTVLVEAPVPQEELPPEAAVEQLLRLEEAVVGVTEVNCALMVPDRGGHAGILRGVEYASALPEANRDRHLVCLSGAGRTPSEVSALLKVAKHGGIRNLLPVSGDAPSGATFRECRRMGFADSMAMTRLAAENPAFSIGAAVNPFQYTAYTLLGQYFKLVGKLHSGASFIVTQSGWDMLKLQSLAWYLASRSLFTPMLAHLTLLTPDRVEQILQGKFPGVRISDDFRRILEKELCYSRNQFEAAQLRRLELQAAGCRLLGFSGVVLAGADLPARAVTAARRIADALREFTSFEQWLEAYNSHLASAEMAPFARHFTLYDRVLHRNYPFDAPPVSNELPQPALSRTERFKNRMTELVFRNRICRRSSSLRILKMLLAGCRGCDDCTLPRNQFVCIRNCPKGLTGGPCGGARPSGQCEIGGAECVYSRIVRAAAWRGELPSVEDVISRP